MKPIVLRKVSTKIFDSSKNTVIQMKFYLSTGKITGQKILSIKKITVFNKCFKMLIYTKKTTQLQ